MIKVYLKIWLKAFFKEITTKHKYKGGPSQWASEYPNAACKHQSPVDIATLNSEFNENFEENALKINFPNECFKYIENNGHTFVVTGEKLGIFSLSGILSNNWVKLN